MLQRDWRLLNFGSIEAIPAALARGRGNAVARALAQGDWLLRRALDGRYLAVVRMRPDGNTWRLLMPSQRWPDGHGHGLGAGTAVRRRIGTLLQQANRSTVNATLPVTQVQRALASLGVPHDYGTHHQLTLVPEPRALAFAGLDRYRRPLFLHGDVADAWQRLRAAARQDGVVLDAISGYRSHAYQLGIFQRKLARGQSVADILRVNAAPGYSEHHSGCALDIGTPGEPPAEESFEATDAFAWLSAQAGEFGFVLSYPRGNLHGIVYEPWHWCWRGA